MVLSLPAGFVFFLIYLKHRNILPIALLHVAIGILQFVLLVPLGFAYAAALQTISGVGIPFVPVLCVVFLFLNRLFKKKGVKKTAPK